MNRFRKSVAGIAVKGEKVFIARRTPGGDLGGKWEFPGGKVEEGEDDAGALRREYREEFGAAVETGEFIARAEFEHGGDVFQLNAYRIFFGSENFRLSEHSQWRWALLGEIEGLDFAASDRSLLPALNAYLDQQPRIQQ